MAFHPETTGLLMLHAPSVNRVHPETPCGIPLSTQRRWHLGFRLPTGSLLAPCPLGRYPVPVPSSYLIPQQKNKGKPCWLADSPYHATAATVSFPPAQPCHPAGLSRLPLRE